VRDAVRAVEPLAAGAAASHQRHRGRCIGRADPEEPRGERDPARNTGSEPFVRGTNTSAPGTGLGLSVVKQLVELQDGRVRVGDAPERGALFEVCLPAATRLPPVLPEG
jgi:hypothetical protein